ncbi:MAG TPA: hypothetical protein VFU16_00800 [Solirubrobacterales bacterium]|nr:hypothetical protein [Solirubrobacterales bacterium]
MKKKWRPEEAPDPEQQAAYDVVISRDPDEIGDRKLPLSDQELLDRLEEVRPEIAHTLSVRAERRFGPAYVVEVQGGRTGGSVHVSVLLAVRYTVRTGAAFAEQLSRFAGEIELEVARGLGEAKSGVQVVAKLDEDSVEQPPTEEPDQNSWDRIAPILGAIATGIGILGLVTFVGGAISWARFEATGLPKEQALSVVPTQDLVVTGGRTLVFAVLWGLLACALYAIGSALAGTRTRRIPSSQALEEVERRGDIIRGIFLAGTLIVAAVIAFLITLETPSLLEFGVFIFLGGLLALLTFVVGKQTARFPFLAATIFLALSIFLGGIAYARALSSPELRGAAIVRKNQKAIIGFFVAENGSKVFLARLDSKSLEEDEIDKSSARLIGIDEEEISSIEVGSPSSPSEALEQARFLAGELCELEITQVPDKKRDMEDQYCWGATLPGEAQGTG